MPLCLARPGCLLSLRLRSPALCTRRPTCADSVKHVCMDSRNCLLGAAVRRANALPCTCLQARHSNACKAAHLWIHVQAVREVMQWCCSPCLSNTAPLCMCGCRSAPHLLNAALRLRPVLDAAGRDIAVKGVCRERKVLGITLRSHPLLRLRADGTAGAPSSYTRRGAKQYFVWYSSTGEQQLPVSLLKHLWETLGHPQASGLRENRAPRGW